MKKVDDFLLSEGDGNTLICNAIDKEYLLHNDPVDIIEVSYISKIHVTYNSTNRMLAKGDILVDSAGKKGKIIRPINYTTSYGNLNKFKVTVYDNRHKNSLNSRYDLYKISPESPYSVIHIPINQLLKSEDNRLYLRLPYGTDSDVYYNDKLIYSTKFDITSIYDKAVEVTESIIPDTLKDTWRDYKDTKKKYVLAQQMVALYRGMLSALKPSDANYNTTDRILQDYSTKVNDYRTELSGATYGICELWEGMTYYYMTKLYGPRFPVENMDDAYLSNSEVSYQYSPTIKFNLTDKNTLYENNKEEIVNKLKNKFTGGFPYNTANLFTEYDISNYITTAVDGWYYVYSYNKLRLGDSLSNDLTVKILEVDRVKDIEYTFTVNSRIFKFKFSDKVLSINIVYENNKYIVYMIDTYNRYSRWELVLLEDITEILINISYIGYPKLLWNIVRSHPSYNLADDEVIRFDMLSRL